MALTIAQSTSGSGSGSGLTSSKSLGSTPTAGNLLIAYIFTGNSTGPTALTFDLTSWTPFERAINEVDNDMTITALYRYVQGGDTTAMPAFCTAGSLFFAYAVQEISGVNGTWANDYQSSRYVQAKNQTSLSVPSDTTRSANCLGLLGFAKYNRSAAGTTDGAWTDDVNTVNGGNYGSFGCAHRAVSSSGTDITATNTFQAGNDTGGMVQVILQTAVPAVPYVVRYRYKGGSGFPGTVQFGGTPLSGHSLVTFLSWQDGGATDPTIGGSWTQWQSVVQGAHHQMFGLYRDVSGDTDVLAAPCSAGSAFWALYTVEVGGMTGVFLTDKLDTKSGAESSSATVTTTADTTGSANQMGLIAFSEYNASANLSQTGAQYTETSVNNSSIYGAWALAFDFHAAGGSTIQQTWTKQSSGAKSAYIQLRMGHGASTETGTGALGFSGISFSGVGGAARAGTGGLAFSGVSFSGAGHRSESGSATLAFAGVSFAGVGSAKHTGAGAMHFAGITLSATGADLRRAPSSNIATTLQNDKLQQLTWNIAAVDPNTGFPTPEFQRKWQKQFSILEAQQKINAAVVPKAYIDAQITSALGAAQTYADGKANAALAAAEAYTDAMVIPGIQVRSGLPAAPRVNTRAVISDSTQTYAAGLGLPDAGGGANTVPMVFIGTWIIG